MKKAIVVLISVIIFSLSSSAQVSVFGKLTGNTVSPCITVFGTKKISEKFVFTYFALVNQKWAESQIGIAYSPV